ncbi:MAG: bifunctional UDP-N-acetylglucosamine diphosphorylase/glucosamine-1-phosphate N-acetyltransferase GlmU [Desulfovibrio sp.]
MDHKNICALVLAAGKGTRMHSAKPKVLQELLGEPMLFYVFEALKSFSQILTVVGYQKEMVEASFASMSEGFVVQAEQLGTGHAVSCGWDKVLRSGATHCLVVNGDTPLITAEHIDRFLSGIQGNAADVDLAFISIEPDNIAGFGRVLRNDDGTLRAIVEKKDYDAAIHGPEPREVNAGIYLINVHTAGKLLERIGNKNNSGEYYLTDLVDLAVTEKMNVQAINCGNEISLMGINSPVEMAPAEDALRERIETRLLESCVVMHQRKLVVVGPKVTVEPGAVLTGPLEIYGNSVVESGATIASHCWIKNGHICSGAEVKPFCHIEEGRVGKNADIGPYGRLRPGAVMEEGSRVGNFVEMKKSVLGKGAKANHFTYLGDAEVGAGVNIGAGTITCNYDGTNKHKTIIGDNSFIGSNTSLVAPVTLGKGALIGAGSVITKDVQEGQLAVARGKQINIDRKRK